MLKSSQAQKFLNKNNFYDKDLGWLHFNKRVLELCQDSQFTDAERLNFYNIFFSNLSEFFMKRLARRIRPGQVPLGSSSLLLNQKSKVIIEEVQKLRVLARRLYRQEINPILLRNGVELLHWKDVRSKEKDFLHNYFQNSIYPALTPITVSKNAPFPLISNMSISLAIKAYKKNKKTPLFTRIKIPSFTPYWIRCSDESSGHFRFVRICNLIEEFIEDVLPGLTKAQISNFRIIRSLEVDEKEDEEADDMLHMVEEELRLRKFAEIVSLECYGRDPWIKSQLLKALKPLDRNIVSSSIPLEYSDFSSLFKYKIPGLKLPDSRPRTPQEILKLNPNNELPFYKVIQKSPLLVHHPYESFDKSVIQFLNEAADDPKVVTIKTTLYRTGKTGAFIEALIKAARNGKQVLCLIELKARLDEQMNIYWAKQLEDEGIHVLYGYQKLKTHAKVLIVVRREGNQLKTYCQVGTGNYNPQTAKLYTDMSYFSSDQKLGSDLSNLFNYLSGASRHLKYEKILVSPTNMLKNFIKLIDREIAVCKKTGHGHIIAKFNNFDCQDIIAKLYEASQAGVKIQLIIRGFSALIPQKKGLSDNIEVVSLLGSHLEHSRIYYFSNGQTDPSLGDYFIGSADWMNRNLKRRIEVVCPIEESEHKTKLWHLFESCLKKDAKVWRMKKTGEYSSPRRLQKTYDVQRKIRKDYKQP